jgi:hypothetical protein
MRRFVPPAIESFDPALTGGEVDRAANARDAAYSEGFLAGQRAGRIEGFAEGEAQARAGWDEEVSIWRARLDEVNACNSVSNGLAQLMMARDADRLAVDEGARAAIAASLEVLFPLLMAHSLGAELSDLIDKAVMARSKEEIVVRASAETIAAITAQGLPEGSAGRVKLRAIPDYPADKADIAWVGGGLTFDPDALLRRVTSMIASNSMRKDNDNA